jgi:tight adherence protein B
VSEARALAFAAAGAGVMGVWDVLAAVQGARLTAWLARALAPLRSAAAEGREPSASERRRLAALAAAALLAAGWLLAGPVLGIAAAVAGPGLSGVVVRARRRRYAREVSAGAAGAARAMAAALAAGRSVRAAVGEAAADVRGAAGHELRAAAHSLSMGEATEPVLDRLRRRAGGGPWDTLVAALLLQRDAGGDLAGLLRGVAASLEDAARAERDAHAATAQSRATAWIVAGLPLAAAVLAEIASPGFVAGLLGNPLSAVLATTAVLLQAAAVLAIRRLSR